MGMHRHVTAYLYRQINITTAQGCNADSDDEETADATYTQFGHSRTVADTHYGRHDGEFPKMRETNLLEYRSQSKKWHRFLVMIAAVQSLSTSAVSPLSSSTTAAVPALSSSMVAGPL